MGYKNRVIVGSLISVVAVMFLTACSDGVLQDKIASSFDVGALELSIGKFAAEPAKVKSGEKTKIVWEVANADTVEITAVGESGTPFDFHVSGDILKGDQETSPITEKTFFKITVTQKSGADTAGTAPLPETQVKAAADEAKPKDENPPAEGEKQDAAVKTKSETIEVNIEASAENTVNVTADKTEGLVPPERAIVQWEVLPADAKSVTVSSSDGQPVDLIFTGEDCTKTDASDLMENGTRVTDTVPSKGCAVVEPAATTTYTVSAEFTSGDKKDGSVTIAIAETPSAEGVVVTIQVDGDKESTRAAGDEVTVSWTVEPEDAKVTVTAEPPTDGDCEPKLPQNEAVEYTEAKCKLSAVPTVFTVTGEKEGLEPSSPATAVVENQVIDFTDADIDVRSVEWAFEGETVDVEISPKAGTDAAGIRDVVVKGVETKTLTGAELVGGKTLSMTVPKEGVSVLMTDMSGKERQYTGVNALATMPSNVRGGEVVSRITFDPNDISKRLIGVQYNNFNKGTARIYVNGAPNDIDVLAALKASIVSTVGQPVGKFFQDYELGKLINMFSINAIAVRPGKSEEVYLGGSGAIMVSKDGGGSFSIFASTMLISDENTKYKGSHSTCKGKVQKGEKPWRAEQIYGLNQSCDIVIGKGGRMIVAVDVGTITFEDVDKGLAKGNRKGKGSPIYNMLTDDLECVDENCDQVFAGAKKGVYKTSDGGSSWEAFGSIGKRVFSVSVVGDKVYAGAEDGVYVSDLSGGSWTKTGLSDKTFSLAVDPNLGPKGEMLIAGTATGVKVSRDSGATWSAIAAGGTGESLAVAVASKGEDSKLVTVGISGGNKLVYGETAFKIRPIKTPPVIDFVAR